VPAPDTLPIPGGLFAYGSVPGVELIPYFFALLTWVGLALGALLLSPFMALFRRLRRGFSTQTPAAKVELTPPPAPVGESTPTPSMPEPPVEGAREHC
jgi:hypothetical protein